MKHLRPCSETPKLEGETPGSISNKFVFVKTLGTGSQGMVLQVVHGQKQVVVKIVPLNEESVEEIRTQCLLTSLHKKTGVFLKAYGWQHVKEIPQHWAKYLTRDDFPEDWIVSGLGFLLIFMEESSEQWSHRESLRITPQEEKAILLLLLHGMAVGRKELELDHGDLHDDNIMLQINSGVGPIVVDGFRIPAGYTRFVPKIIDFGLSTTKYSPSKEEEEESSEDEFFGGAERGSTDISTLAFFFPKFDKLLKPAKGSVASNYQILEKILASSKEFDEFRVNNENVENVRCYVCQSEAKNVLENTKMPFCGSDCLKFYLF